MLSGLRLYWKAAKVNLATTLCANWYKTEMSFRILFAAAFTLPFLALIALDTLILGRGYALEYNDATLGGFPAGVDWLTFHGWSTPHHPAYLFHQSTALLVAATGVYPKDLGAFHTAVLIANGFVQFATGFWGAGAARRLGLTVCDGLVLGIAVITMPAVLVYADQWTVFPWMAALFAAFALVFAEVWLLDRLPRRSWWSAGIGLGFLAGLYFPALPLALLIGMITLVRVTRSTPETVERWFGFEDRPPTAGLVSVTYATIWVTGAVIGTIPMWFVMFPKPWVYAYDWGQLGVSFLAAIGIATIPTAAIYWAERKLGRWGRLIPAAAGPVLIGWLIAGNVMAPFWYISAMGAIRSRTGLYDFSLFFDRLFEHYWNLFLIAVIGLLALTAFVSRRLSLRTLLALAAMAASLLALATAMKTFGDMPAVAVDPGRFGQGPRVVMVGLFTIVVAYILYRSHRATAVGAILIVGAISVWQYVTNIGPATREVRATVDSFNAFATQRLGEAGQLLCAGSRIPDDCGMAYAYTHTRYPPATRILPSPKLRGGAVCYTRTLPTTCEQAEELWRAAGCILRSGEMLISQETGSQLPRPPNSILQGPFYGLGMNMARCPAQ
jgi:hypothetical protein